MAQHSNGEMVERIARIIDPGAWAVMDAERKRYPADPAERFKHRDSIAKARCVLEAMREPTEGMLAAGEEFHGYDMIDAQPDKWWQAMIDAALGDQE